MRHRAIAVRPDDFTRSDLNCPSRTWPESNCYLDLWIGLLQAVGQDARPLMGAAAGMGWEADHFTFIKPSAADLFDLAGVVMHEMAVWDEVEPQVAAQLASGSIPLPEVDSYFLPDTGDYRRQHGKTTIGITAIDTSGRTLEYVHNGGLFHLGDEDYAGLLNLAPHTRILFPYAELARLPVSPPDAVDQREAARRVLGRLMAMRKPGNPVADFARALPLLLSRPGMANKVHALCFNTARQLGAGFGLLAEHLEWLGHDAQPAERLADQAKTVQFQLARAARRGRSEPSIILALESMAETWSDTEAVLLSVISEVGIEAGPPNRRSATAFPAHEHER